MDRGTLLLGILKRKNISAEQLAKDLNMDRSTFYRKSPTPQASFTCEQALKLKASLILDAMEFESIFF